MLAMKLILIFLFLDKLNINNAQYNYKKRCRDESTPIHKIYTQEIQKVVIAFQRIPAFNTVKTTGYTYRWKDLGKLPKSTSDIKIINDLRLTTDSDNFLFYQS